MQEKFVTAAYTRVYTAVLSIPLKTLDGESSVLNVSGFFNNAFKMVSFLCCPRPPKERIQ